MFSVVFMTIEKNSLWCAIHDNREGFIHYLLFMTIENDSYIVCYS